MEIKIIHSHSHDIAIVICKKKTHTLYISLLESLIQSSYLVFSFSFDRVSSWDEVVGT